MTRSGFVMGDWQVYPDQGILSGPPGEQHLEPKVMEVLVFLADRQGEVARREDLLSAVWAGTIVTDEALSRTVSILRTQLGDNPREPRYIQTIPKVGYRLLMPVRTLPPVLAALAAQPASPRRKWPVVLMFVALAAAVMMFVGPNRDKVQPGGPAEFASISDWFDYLEEQWEGGTPPISIAVLPFKSYGDSSSIEAFGDGLADELRTLLSKVQGLKVSPRRSAESFRDRADDLRNIARELNVAAVLDGTIREEGDGYRINLQVVDAIDGLIIWSSAVEVAPENLYGALEALVADAVAELDRHFDDVELEVPTETEPEPDSEAYVLYLMNGNKEWQMRGEEPLRRSIEMYRQALALDPDFNRARVALARAMVLLPWYSTEPVEPTFEAIEAMFATHEFKDPRVQAEAESVRAFMAWKRWQWLQAEEHFRRSLKLAPDLANTFQWYSQHLSNVGRVEESLEAAERAWELDEVSPQVNDRLGTAYLWADDNLRAAEHFARSKALGFNNAINPAYAIFLIRLQRFDELRAVIETWYYGAPGEGAWLAQHVDTIFAPEHRAEALEAVRKAAAHGPVILPQLEFGLWGLLGGVDEVFATFEKYRNGNQRNLPLEFLFTGEAADIREDSRFDVLAKEIGWTEYWAIYGRPDYQE